MLILSEEILNQIQSSGASAYPYEGCGLLLGTANNGDNLVHTIYPVPNRWEIEEERRVRFRIAEEDLLQAELSAAESGHDVIGVFHSHPDHPPIASPRDLAWATWPGYSYLITEVVGGEPGISRSWQLMSDRQGFEEESVTLNEKTANKLRRRRSAAG